MDTYKDIKILVLKNAVRGIYNYVGSCTGKSKGKTREMKDGLVDDTQTAGRHKSIGNTEKSIKDLRDMVTVLI